LALAFRWISPCTPVKTLRQYTLLAPLIETALSPESRPFFYPCRQYQPFARAPITQLLASTPLASRHSSPSIKPDHIGSIADVLTARIFCAGE
jgi:hypothetical protein